MCLFACFLQNEAIATGSDDKSTGLDQGEPLIPEFSTSQNLLSSVEQLVGAPCSAQHLFWCILVSAFAGSWFSRLPILLALIPQALFLFNILSLPKDNHQQIKLSLKIPIARIKSVSCSPHGHHLKISAFQDNNTLSNSYFLLNSSERGHALSDHLKRISSIDIQIADEFCASNLASELAKRTKIGDIFASTILYRQRVALSMMMSRRGVFHLLLLTKSHVVLGQESLDTPNASIVACNPLFTVLAAISVKAILKTFAMKDLTEESAAAESSQAAANSVTSFFYHFGYYLFIECDTGEKIDVRFPSKESRDQFLNVFTEIRQSQMANNKAGVDVLCFDCLCYFACHPRKSLVFNSF